MRADVEGECGQRDVSVTRLCLFRDSRIFYRLSIPAAVPCGTSCTSTPRSSTPSVVRRHRASVWLKPARAGSLRDYDASPHTQTHRHVRVHSYTSSFTLPSLQERCIPRARSPLAQLPMMAVFETSSCAVMPATPIMARRPLLSSLVFIAKSSASVVGIRPIGSKPSEPGS